jgi:hypothetical protein
MSRTYVPEGRLPLSLSPSNGTPLRQTYSSDVETLCAALRQTQQKEHELMACIQNTLERMHGRSPATPPHVLYGHSGAEVLTVDAKAVWSRSPVQSAALKHSYSPPVASPAPRAPCEQCSLLEATVQGLRRDNAALRERQDRLEAALNQLQPKVVAFPSPHIDSTPQRRLNHSNVLLHDSTRKLLAEAERQLQLQDVSHASAC